MGPSQAAISGGHDRLESWKEIAAYLGRDIRTVQRWERSEGLPVRRHMHAKQGSVYALRSELDVWRRTRDQLAVQPDQPPAGRVGPRSLWGLPQWITIGVGVAGLSLAGAVLLHRSAGSPDEPLAPIPFTTLRGSEISPAFSPDGRRVAFAWNGNPTRRFQIYVQSLDSKRLTQITNDESDSYSPAWSPGGDQIAFLRGGLGQPTSLMMAPAAGGPVREVASIESGNPPWNRNLSWSADGRWLASGATAPGKGLGIVLVSAANGSQRVLTRPTGAAADMMPVFSLDGREIVFVRDNQRDPPKLERLRLFADERPEGEPEELPYARCKIESEKCLDPWWVPGRPEILFTSRGGGMARLWRAAVPGGTPRQLTYTGEGATHPAVSPAGDALLYEQLVKDTNIYVADLGRSGESVPTIVSTRMDQNPSVSPDGRRILFESNRSGHDEIWVSDVNGANAAALTTFDGPITGSPRWSPDGAWIAFDSRASGRPEIYVMDANGGNRRRLTWDALGNMMPCWSADGKWIYFTSLRTGGRQIWKMPAGGGNATAVTQKGGTAAFASPDGQWIWYMKSASPVTSLWRVPTEGGAESEVVDSLLYRSAAAAGNYLYYFRFTAATGAATLERLDPATGRVDPIVTPARPVGMGISLSPDLRKVYFTQVDAEESDLMLVRGFR
jgi:Tol biopolymer transport system component